LMAEVSDEDATRFAEAGYRVVEVASRPCPNCMGVGRDVREAARLVLDALPWRYTEDERRALFGWGVLPATVTLGGSGEEVSTTHRPGDATSTEALGVWADKWQADGDPLGFAIACWLRTRTMSEPVVGWRADALAGVKAAWERLTIPCAACDGS